MIRGCSWFLVLAGLAMCAFGVYFIDLGSKARSWPRVDGRILATGVEVSTSRGSGSGSLVRHYFPRVRYAWTVDGVDYTGDRYRLGTTHDKSAEREDAVEAAKAFPAGTTIAVYYDPRDPSQAVLEPAMSWSVVVPLVLGLLFALGGAAMVRHREALGRAAARGDAEPLELG